MALANYENHHTGVTDEIMGEGGESLLLNHSTSLGLVKYT